MENPEIVADDEEPGPEPEGFWRPIHAEVKRLVKLGRADDETS
jgi:hypothetical protein